VNLHLLTLISIVVIIGVTSKVRVGKTLGRRKGVLIGELSVLRAVGVVRKALRVVS